MRRRNLFCYFVLLTSCSDPASGRTDVAGAADATPPDISAEVVDMGLNDLDAAERGLDVAAHSDAGTGAPDTGHCGGSTSLTCTGTLTESACLASSGLYFERLRPSCICPTPDIGCPCDSSDDCVGLCVDLDVADARSCQAIRRGECSGYTNVPSCVCILGPEVGIAEGESRVRCL